MNKLLYASILILIYFSNNLKAEIWSDLRSSFVLNHNINNSRVISERNRFIRDRFSLNRLLAKSEPYLYYILQEIKKRDMPVELALVPIIESGFDPFAYSHVGAAGLWQIMPGTGSGLGLKQDFWTDKRRDIRKATDATLDYLSYLHKFFNGDWSLVLAAYNAGEGTVQRAVRNNRQAGKSTSFWSLSLPNETRYYVPRIYALADIIRRPSLYRVNLPNIPNKPYFSAVKIEQQMDLTYVARLAGINIRKLHDLNPAHNQWLTHPEGSHEILLPVENARIFKNNYDKNNTNILNWHNHKVKVNENLAKIALDHNIDISLIKQVNNLNSDKLKIGQSLKIPQKIIVDYRANWRRSIKRVRSDRGPKQIIHTVKKGENINNIARKYRVRATAIASWNQIKGRVMLRTDQQLIIWSSNRSIINRYANTSRPSAGQVVYIVKKGDTLSRIAQRHRVKVADLQRWNPESKSKYLQIGQKLVIY